jgi:hypothetical protein
MPESKPVLARETPLFTYVLDSNIGYVYRVASRRCGRERAEEKRER